MNTREGKLKQTENRPALTGLPAQLAAGKYALGLENNRPRATIQKKQVEAMAGRSSIQMKGKLNINDDKELEKEADIMGTHALKGIGAVTRIEDESSNLLLARTGKGAPIQRAIEFEYDDITGEEVFPNRKYGDEDLYAYLTEEKGLKPTQRLLNYIMHLDAINAIFSDVAELIDVLQERGILAPDDKEKNELKKEEQVEEEDDDEVYYTNENGAAITESDYMELQTLIDNYDVALEGADFGRGSSLGTSETNKIGVGLGDLATFVKSNKILRTSLKFVFHPGKGKNSRSVKYGGRSFMDILDMCSRGEECHNDLANALRECLSTLQKDKD